MSVIPSTILSFSPGELSTVEGPLHGFVFSEAMDPDGPPASIKAFDFRDLPCPPRSVMVRPAFTDSDENQATNPGTSGSQLV